MREKVRLPAVRQNCQQGPPSPPSQAKAARDPRWWGPGCPGRRCAQPRLTRRRQLPGGAGAWGRRACLRASAARMATGSRTSLESSPGTGEGSRRPLNPLPRLFNAHDFDVQSRARRCVPGAVPHVWPKTSPGSLPAVSIRAGSQRPLLPFLPPGLHADCVLGKFFNWQNEAEQTNCFTG